MKLKIQNSQSTLWILLTAAIICIIGCNKKTPQQAEETPAKNTPAIKAPVKKPFRASLNDVRNEVELCQVRARIMLGTLGLAGEKITRQSPRAARSSQMQPRSS